MTIILKSKNREYLDSALKLGLSVKAAAVYVCLLEAKKALSPVVIISLTGLHRQYVFDGLHELIPKHLVDTTGSGRGIKYFAHTPEKALTIFEEQRLRAIEGASHLMGLFKKNPLRIMEIIEGAEAVVESEIRIMREQEKGSYLDIIGGAARGFLEIFGGRLGEYERARRESLCKSRFIGAYSDIKLDESLKIENRFDYEIRYLDDIDNIVNTCVRPDSVSFNIYYPEAITIRIKNSEIVESQHALFELLWGIARETPAG